MLRSFASHGSGDVGTRVVVRETRACDLERPEQSIGTRIWCRRLLEEKGTTPEPGGEARIPVGLGRDTPDVDPPLPSFTTPTPVHDGESRTSFSGESIARNDVPAKAVASPQSGSDVLPAVKRPLRLPHVVSCKTGRCEEENSGSTSRFPATVTSCGSAEPCLRVGQPRPTRGPGASAGQAA